MAQIVKEINYKDWNIQVRCDAERPYLQVQFREHDKWKATTTTQSGRKWFLSPHMTRSEIVQTAFKAVLTAEEHETRERFHYKGAAIFGPHFNVDVLVGVCESGTHLEHRAMKVTA
jgi:hypothetical protein